MTTIRFGLIGAGVAAETHARELARVAGASLQAVFARDATKAAAFAATFSIPRHYADLSAFLADPALDAVIIATPNGLHLDHAIAVAAAGKHLIVEKPLEITEARASAILDACQKSGVGLFVVYQRRHSAAAAQALEDVRSGALGRIVLVNIVDNEFRRPSYYQNDAWRGTWAIEGGGCVMTQSTHLIDLAQFILGPIRQVFARTATRHHAIETEDVAAAVFEFADGSLGTFSSSTAAFPGQRHLLTISGTEGSLIFNGEHDQIVFRHVRGGEASAIPADFSFGDPIDPRDYPTTRHRAQLETIVATLAAGSVPTIDADDLLRAARVIDAIYRSAREGMPVRIAPGPAD
ncbi:Gfo/Idh/MocA family protein [Ancylobacter amanitiformis]|uniref:Dehydrogenase n=1 Tax=Ancylobacter amanitiformis TaxID=217069 RepID=A0ABU0LXF1_9HYPH|nr:Gfo/Idh/MocA family oxidoreductase [Ancylobacter amanitiformis]MDQ0513397.1 putative dehydrogenase [Ancylobacter amanitiformis]